MAVWVAAALVLAVIIYRAREAVTAPAIEDLLPPPDYAPPPPWPDDLPSVVPDVLPGGHNEYDNQVRYACGLYGLTDPLAPLLVKAIISHESGWNAAAGGDPYRCLDLQAGTDRGAYRGNARYRFCCSLGLMQVNRCAHADLAARYNLLDPNENILAGCELLAVAYRAWWPIWSRVLVGYNGPALAAAGVVSNSYSDAVGGYFRRFASEGGIIV